MNTPGEGPRLDIRLLGPFDARIDGVPLSRVRTRKGLHLLALLALRHCREVQREWLAASLWPDSDVEKGAYNLRRALSDLRAALGPAGDYLTTPAFHTLCLDGHGRVSVDLSRFDALCHSAKLESLREAAELYRGQLLEGWNEEWALGDRNARQQAWMRALSLLAGEAESRAAWDESARWLRRALSEDPFDERAQRNLMEALARSGSHAAATLAYREFRAFLRREINAEPAAETTALYQRLQREARGAKKPTPVPASAAKPERPRANGLPVLLTSFVGREGERRDVKALLAKSRLLTLVGTGGCGKTRLALQVASEIEAAYIGGVWWLEFAALTRGEAVWRAVASALGVKEEGGRPLEEAVCAAVGTRRTLLVLDNCEHLLDAMGRMAATLLRNCPEARILATSREPLNVTGETTWRVPSLSAPKYGHAGRLSASDRAPATSSVLGYEAVRLFADRAAMAEPRFAVTDSNARDVAQICSRLDGIPLAIELAASRVATLTAGQIASRLDDRFRLLKWGRSDLMPRQQTLRALIDWSHDLLTDLERVLFRRLAVFAGGWTLEAAESVVVATGGGRGTSGPLSLNLEPSDVLELHSRLVDKSLVVFERDGSGEGRYRMLETIRQYALERLREAGEESVSREQHARWYSRFAKDASDRLAGPEQGRFLTLLEADHDNLRTALEATISCPDGLETACSLWRFWYVRGRLREAGEWFERGLTQNPRAPAPIRAQAQLRAGIFAWARGRADDAEGWLTRCLALFREQGDDTGIASALNNLGMIAQNRGDLHNACRYFGETVGFFRRTGQKPGLAAALLNHGAALHSVGELVRSRALHEESLRIRRELEDTRGIASTAGALGRVLAELGEFAAARGCFAESVALKTELEDPYGLTQTMFGIAYFAAAREDFRGAARLLGCAQKMREELGAGEGLEADPSLTAALERARAALGPDPYERAWNDGRNLNAADLIHMILSADGP